MKMVFKVLGILVIVAILIGLIFFVLNFYNEKTFKNDNEKLSTFYGTIIESNMNYIIVEPYENEEERNSADRYSISLGQNQDTLYEIGTNVKVTYTGGIMESYPAQINVINIEIKSADSFEIIFEQKNDLEIKKILNKGEMKKYDYNIYSYGGDINIMINNKTTSLRESLLNNKITIDEIITKANEDLNNKKINGDFYKDGGSALYQYEKYTILKYHTLDGNRDVYIGRPEMTINVRKIEK